MPRFSVSLGFHFTDVPLTQRFARAAEAGFAAVEFFWPDGAAEELVAAKKDAGVDVALFNMNEGDYRAGDRGFACRPELTQRWRQDLDAALRLAEQLHCARVNVLTGKIDPGVNRQVFVDTFVDNLRWAAPRARDAGVVLVVEALNHLTHPLCLAQRTHDVLALLDMIDEDSVAVQFDIFHAQSSEGNIVGTLREHIDRFGHIQIADVPSRGAPGSGELNFAYILSEIDRLGYEGWVGLEYLPSNPPESSFDWLESLSATGVVDGR